MPLRLISKWHSSALTFIGTIAVLVLMVAALFGGAVPQSVAAYKSPGTPSGFINDYAGLLTATQKSDLEQKARSLEQTTGTELSVVTVADLGGDSVEEFAAALFKEWGIGKRGKDNGVLVLVARDDREVRIEVGYGAEAVVTDAFSGKVIRDIILPAFKAGDYNAGIAGAVDKIAAALADPAAAELWTKSSMGGTIPGNGMLGGMPIQALFILGFFILFVFARAFAGFAQSRAWWPGALLGFFFGLFISRTLLIAIIAAIIGLIVDFIASTFFYGKFKNAGRHGGGPWFFGGGSSGGFGGGGFGGFGGGSSGGGGASGRW